MQTDTLKDRFFNQGEQIRYRCWGLEGGFVIAKWVAGRWFHRHETDADFSSEQMSEARARYIFPHDAQLVGA